MQPPPSSSATDPGQGAEEGRRILVTGAAGFVGRHLVSHLVQQGAAVMATRRRTTSSSQESAIGLLSWVEIDLVDRAAVAALAGSFDTVVHLAGVGLASQALEQPLACFEANSLSTVNLLEACRRHGAQMVFVSTAQVYGRPQYLPADEQHPAQPTHPYPSSKVVAEIMVRAYQASYGLPAVILRPSNIYGPGQSNVAVVAALTEQVVSGTLSPMALTPVRDFVYVADFVQAIDRAIRAGSIEGPVNISSGQGVSIQTIADQLMDLAPTAGLTRPVLIPPLAAAGAGPDEVFFSSRRAEACLGWKPQTRLREGLLACLRHAAARSRPAPRPVG